MSRPGRRGGIGREEGFVVCGDWVEPGGREEMRRWWGVRGGGLVGVSEARSELMI